MIHHGDLFDVLPTLDAESIDACITDPPYDLISVSRNGSGRSNEPDNPYGRHGSKGGGFMGLKWDSTGVAFRVETWQAVHRVLKPGAHLIAFGGTRTFHRLTCAIEDAGFEIRDCLSWLYGQGFPKSLNMGDGRGTALKPGWEPIVLARKPTTGTVKANAERYGTGTINIDACRIETDGRPLREKTAVGDTTLGRWPANVALDDEAAAMLDEQTGELHQQDPASRKRKTAATNTLHGSPFHDAIGKGAGFGDSGGASRFYYVAKPSRDERDYGCGRNGHPTVKPVELMRWLVRLVTPPNGIVLDPFCGSGTTGMACRYELRQFIGIEREAEYVAVAELRIAACVPLFSDEVSAQ